MRTTTLLTTYTTTTLPIWYCAYFTVVVSILTGFQEVRCSRSGLVIFIEALFSEDQIVLNEMNVATNTLTGVMCRFRNYL